MLALASSSFANEARNINRFAFDFYKSMQSEVGGENVLFSPYYIYKTLGDLQFCAEGGFKEQIGKVLQNSGGGASLDEFEDKELLKSASSLWVAASEPLNDGFVKYSSEKLALDVFSENLQDADSLRAKILDWAKSKPQILGKDCDMLGAVNFSENLGAVLLSISSFDAKWKVPFDKRKTREGTFFYGKDLSESAKIDFMWRFSNDIAYADTENFQFARIPYEGEKYSMVVVKARKGGDLDSIGQGEFDNFLKMLRDTRFTYGKIYLPKFSIKKPLDCASILKKMGLDFSQPAKARFFQSDKSSLLLGKFFTSCLMEVDEVSTKVKSLNSADMPFGVANLNLNSPFMFFIVESESGAIIYMGKFCKPIDMNQ